MKKHFPLLMLVLVNLIVGTLALPAFGESVDELSQHSYAERTLQGVSSLIAAGPWPAYFTEEAPKQGSHGPVFMMVVVLLQRLFLPEGTAVERLQFGHLLYFVTFQAGTVSLFFLARRWVSAIAAFGTALLFTTQPLLVGHAFMNPKDVVFMCLLITSAALGLRMVDHVELPFQRTGSPVWDGTRLFFRQFLRLDVWVAGFGLGFSSAIRLAAPLVSVVVLAEILLSRQWQRLFRFLAYGLIALGFMVLFWPYLWPDPFARVMDSILHSMHYPDQHMTLFRGQLVDAEYTPRSYLPVLLPVQLTETTLLLVLAGLPSMAGKPRRDLAVLTLVWFVLPAVAIAWLRVHLYNNTRQVFFILPPLFLIAALGLDWLWRVLRRPVARYLIMFLILLPGLYANITLHPYQYVYYNQLVGGVRGAYRVFELDYWHLAFKEAQTYVNGVAEENADIFAGNSKTSAETFARPDLVFNAFGARKKNWDRYDYIIVSTAENADEKFAAFPTVFKVERQGVPLVLVKKTLTPPPDILSERPSPMNGLK